MVRDGLFPRPGLCLRNEDGATLQIDIFAASIPKINQSQLFGTSIPLPPLATQQAIVAEIEAEQALVNANRELIARFENKIQATLARIWGEKETSPAES